MSSSPRTSVILHASTQQEIPCRRTSVGRCQLKRFLDVEKIVLQCASPTPCRSGCPSVELPEIPHGRQLSKASTASGSSPQWASLEVAAHLRPPRASPRKHSKESVGSVSTTEDAEAGSSPRLSPEVPYLPHPPVGQLKLPGPRRAPLGGRTLSKEQSAAWQKAEARVAAMDDEAGLNSPVLTSQDLDAQFENIMVALDDKNQRWEKVLASPGEAEEADKEDWQRAARVRSTKHQSRTTDFEVASASPACLDRLPTICGLGSGLVVGRGSPALRASPRPAPASAAETTEERLAAAMHRVRVKLLVAQSFADPADLS